MLTLHLFLVLHSDTLHATVPDGVSFVMWLHLTSGFATLEIAPFFGITQHSRRSTRLCHFSTTRGWTLRESSFSTPFTYYNHPRHQGCVYLGFHYFGLHPQLGALWIAVQIWPQLNSTSVTLLALDESFKQLLLAEYSFQPCRLIILVDVFTPIVCVSSGSSLFNKD